MEPLNKGDVVFFREASHDASGRKKKLYRFIGHGWGIFIGAIPDGMPEPHVDIVITNLGTIGFVKIDDMVEILGKEVTEGFLKKWQEKYTARIDALAKKAVEEGKLKLAGPDGRPLKIVAREPEPDPNQANLPGTEHKAVLLGLDPHVPLEIAPDGTVTKVGNETVIE